MPISIDNGVINKVWDIEYDGRRLQVEASEQRFHHSLIAKDKTGFRRRHPFDLFFRVLNELVWFNDLRVTNLNGGHGEYCANLNFLAGDDAYMLPLCEFKQQVELKNQHLALGFFREGHSSGSAFYEFICYAKILEIPFKNGKDKGAWIDRAISDLRDEMALTVRDRKVVMLGDKSLGLWLKQDGRDALSHAKILGGATVRDPNCYRDWDEIKWGNIVMRELAEKIMVEDLQIPIGDAAFTY